MSIEGLGKRLQDARLKRGLTLDEAARMTKIRPSRLAEIEADDFSNFASLAYVKGFLLIYGKFLDVDVTDFMEAFDSPEQVTVDGYSYLQDNPAPKPVRPAVVRRSSGSRTSLMPFFVGVVIIVLGFAFMKFILNILRVSPRTPPPQTQTVQPAPTAVATLAPTATPAPTAVVVSTPRPAPSVESTPARIAAAPTVAPSATIAPTATPVATASAAAVAVATPTPAAEKEPEVRRAQPVHAEDLAKSGAANSTASSPAAKASPATTTGTQNSVAIKPLRRTYVKVVVDNEARTPAFERWISPTDGTVEFKGQHIDVRILDRDAVQIRKNGKMVVDDDTDVTIE
jgi:cytoskeletal protein RodZ